MCNLELSEYFFTNVLENYSILAPTWSGPTHCLENLPRYRQDQKRLLNNESKTVLLCDYTSRGTFLNWSDYGKCPLNLCIML